MSWFKRKKQRAPLVGVARPADQTERRAEEWPSLVAITQSLPDLGDCPKCGWQKVFVGHREPRALYMEAGHLRDGAHVVVTEWNRVAIHERLSVRCKRCDYAWFARPIELADLPSSLPT